MGGNIGHLISFLNKERHLDITCYNRDFLTRCLNERLSTTKTKDYCEYIAYLQENHNEITSLINGLSISVSKFFRDPVTFDVISEKILPYLIYEKIKEENKFLRIWSAGCASGEEPYSIAIILNELLGEEIKDWNISIFATDIDEISIEKAKEGIYSGECLENIRYGLVKKYFTKEDPNYRINNEIKDMVNYSVYDLTDRNSYVPPECIFAGFDLVLCRNVLIYFEESYQKVIITKLYHSLSKPGFLVLGKYERLYDLGCFNQYSNLCKIYEKWNSVRKYVSMKQ